MLYHAESPMGSRRINFLFMVAPLLEEAARIGADMRRDEGKQLRQRRQRPGGHDIRLGEHGAAILDPRRMGRSGEPQIALDRPQECDLLAVGLDEIDAEAGTRGGNHQPGQARARPQIHAELGFGKKPLERQRISDVAGPDITDRRWRDEVHAGLPFGQQRNVAVKPLERFT